MKIKFVILTCPKYHDTRLKTIEETWGLNKDILWLSDENIGNNIIGFDDIPRGYDYVWMKYLRLFERVDINADWVVFCDDDTWVNYKNLYSILENNNTDEPIVIGRLGYLGPDGTDLNGQQTGYPIASIKGDNSELPLSYCGGGAGFALNIKAFKSIKNYINSNVNKVTAYHSDVTIGFWMRNSGIKMINNDTFWWGTHKSLNHSDEEVVSNTTYHYVDSELMKHYFEIC